MPIDRFVDAKQATSHADVDRSLDEVEKAFDLD